jgi:hypothetical protein
VPSGRIEASSLLFTDANMELLTIIHKVYIIIVNIIPFWKYNNFVMSMTDDAELVEWFLASHESLPAHPIY